MSVLTVAPSRNGTKPQPRVVPLLGPKIDHLLELRGLIARARDEERQMTAEIVQAMAAAGVARLQGHEAAAILEQRTTLKPDPGLVPRGGRRPRVCGPHRHRDGRPAADGGRRPGGDQRDDDQPGAARRAARARGRGMSRVVPLPRISISARAATFTRDVRETLRAQRRSHQSAQRPGGGTP